jgi:hypothetical protein
VNNGGLLDLGATAAVVIAQGGELSVEGTGSSGDAITIDSGAEITVSGTYTLAPGTEGTNNGTITTGPGGVLYAGAGVDVDISGGGVNIVQAGGEVYFEGDPIPFVGNDANARLQLINGTLTSPSGGFAYLLEGEITLNHVAASGSDLALYGNRAMEVSEGSVVTIATDALLTFYDTDGLVGNIAGASAASQIVVNGTIVADSGYTSNFYDAGNTVISSTTIPAGIYVWTVDADGVSSSGNDGWLAQP